MHVWVWHATDTAVACPLPRCSWVDIKGTGWVVENNRGRNTLKDGFQTHDQPSAYGDSGA